MKKEKLFNLEFEVVQYRNNHLSLALTTSYDLELYTFSDVEFQTTQQN